MMKLFKLQLLSALVIAASSTVSAQDSTANVECDYKDSSFNSSESVNATSEVEWSCSDTLRTVTGNGLPDHPVGKFPNRNNPHAIEAQTVNVTFPMVPKITETATELGGPRGGQGYVLNGVKIDAGTAGSCDDTGTDCSLADPRGNWSIEAIGQNHFDFGEDENKAHVQPGGSYHYHGMPEGFVTKRGGNSSSVTLIGWAADGFPIYARYGYSDANDADSSIVAMRGSFQLKEDVPASRPSADTYELGTFRQDWEYAAGLGDLDECNGRYGVTPEFPEGIYHYYATDDYPYFQRCVKGAVEVRERGPRPENNGERPRRGGKKPRRESE